MKYKRLDQMGCGSLFGIELQVDALELNSLVTTDFYDVNLCPECQIPITYSHSHIHAHL